MTNTVTNPAKAMVSPPKPQVRANGTLVNSDRQHSSNNATAIEKNAASSVPVMKPVITSAWNIRKQDVNEPLTKLSDTDNKHSWPAPNEVLTVEDSNHTGKKEKFTTKGRPQWKHLTPMITHSKSIPGKSSSSGAASMQNGRRNVKKTPKYRNRREKKNANDEPRKTEPSSLSTAVMPNRMSDGMPSTTAKSSNGGGNTHGKKNNEVGHQRTKESSSYDASDGRNNKQRQKNTTYNESQSRTNISHPTAIRHHGVNYYEWRHQSGYLPGMVPYYAIPNGIPAYVNVDDKTLKSYIVQQIEYYFSIDNLCKDMYLRRQMDSEGYVDIKLLANFNRIKSLTTDLDMIHAALKDSVQLQVKNDKTRKLKGWENWLISPLTKVPPAYSSPQQSRTTAANIVKRNIATQQSNPSSPSTQIKMPLDSTTLLPFEKQYILGTSPVTTTASNRYSPRIPHSEDTGESNVFEFDDDHQRRPRTLTKHYLSDDDDQQQQHNENKHDGNTGSPAVVSAS